MKNSTYSHLSSFDCSFTLLSLSSGAGSLINNFTTPLDYVANGIIGDTNWDGVYLRFGDVQNGNAGGSGNGNTTIANSAVTYAGYLGVRSIGSDLGGAGGHGFYILKLGSGDFDVFVPKSPFHTQGGRASENCD